MKKLSMLSALLLTACVTINIYFPAAAAEKVADEIIQDIQTLEPNKPQSSINPKSALPAWQVSVYQLLDKAISVVISSAHAEANLSVDSADIRRITAEMRARFVELNPFYDQGVLAIQADGLLTTKGNVSLKDRNKINKLIAAENADRYKLYQAIADANGHPEWAEQIKATFAQRWITNAQPGWWYQAANGSWRQK
ncbi:MAG: YdbL family protein [Methylococcaceae bacterium]|nr:YdbL family protein [Methylococcaceae bacterium]